MPRTGKKLWAVAILSIVLSILLLSAFSLSASAAKATATPKPVLTLTSALTPTPTPVPQICIITGRVVDPHGNGIGGAKITLYNMTTIDGRNVDTGLTTINLNPQYTSGGEGSNAGYYQFSGVPSGMYDIILDVNGMRYPKIIEVTRGTVTWDFVVSPSDNTPSTSTTPAPTTIPGPTPGEPVVTVIPAGPTPAEKQGNDDPLVLRAGITVLIIMQFMVACVALWLVMRRRM